jgi:ESS family glutamate:Na+ symporter
MISVSVDMFQTLAIAVGAVYLGYFIRKKVYFFERFCFPAPVIGGGIISILLCILHAAGILDVSFDETLKDVCMVVFFTSVGYDVNVKVLKSGGKILPRLLMIVAILAFAQNGIAVAAAMLLKINPLIGMCTGSIPMLGGHGTSAAFGPVLEDLGLKDATTICTAAATFGLIGGSLIGGPIGNALIVHKKLLSGKEPEENLPKAEVRITGPLSFALSPAARHLAIAVGIGSVVSVLISKTGLIFPKYIGGLIVGALISNIGIYSGKYKVYAAEVRDIGEIMLEFFLGIALITLKIWVLADLAAPLVIMLILQLLFMVVFARFAVFPILGGNYEAAVLTSGVCGFGMGATPNAMANLQAVTYKRPYSTTAFLLIPIVGGLFLDLINSFTILFFINLISR